MWGAATPFNRRRALAGAFAAAAACLGLGLVGPGDARAVETRSVTAPAWKLWGVEVTDRAPSLAPARLRQLRRSGVNALVVDSRRVSAKRLAATVRGAGRHGFTLISPHRVGGKGGRSASQACRSTKQRGACALTASSPKAALQLARWMSNDLVVVVRLSGPAALRRLPVANRPGRILALVALTADRASSTAWQRALVAVAARNDLDVAVVPRPKARLTRYLGQLATQLGTRDRRAPAAPSAVAVSSRSADSLRLSWRSARDNRRLSGYTVYRAGARVASTGSPSLSLTGLDCETRYSLAVDSVDSSGNHSRRTAIAAATAPCIRAGAGTPPTSGGGGGGGSGGGKGGGGSGNDGDVLPPGTPLGLTKTSGTTTSITVDWTGSSDNVALAGYGLYRDGTLLTVESATTYVFGGLTCGRSYTLAVDAFDAAGNRSQRTSISAATSACPPPSSDTTTPTTPTGLTNTGTTTNSLTVSWPASSDNVGVTGYGLYRNGTLIAGRTSRSYTFAGLTCGMSYTLGVDAYDAAGNRSAKRSLTTSTSACPGDMQAPSVPAGLTATSTSTSALSVSWSAASDNVGVAGYGYYLGGSLVGNGTGTSYTFAGLVCGTGYTLGVDAFDAAGNRSGRASFSAATSACPPPPPAGELTPPARARTIVNAPSGTTVENDTYYRDPQGTLRYPNDLQRVTVTGAKNMPNYVRNWRDVWVEGKPGEPMNLGPATNQDLMQIKRYPDSAPTPENLTFRYFRMHDLTRTDSTHTDGLQLMAGKNIRFLDGTSENVDVQPFFMRDGGPNTGGGPIEDILFQRITVTGTSGYYTFRVSGDNEETNGYVPTRVKIIDCAGDKPVSIDAAAARRGSETINYRRL